MSDNNYSEDKRYILETLKHTADYVSRLDGKFEDFKLDTAKSIIVIQTKLAMYVAGGSVITAVIVNYVTKALGFK